MSLLMIEGLKRRAANASLAERIDARVTRADSMQLDWRQGAAGGAGYLNQAGEYALCEMRRGHTLARHNEIPAPELVNDNAL